MRRGRVDVGKFPELSYFSFCVVSVGVVNKSDVNGEDFEKVWLLHMATTVATAWCSHNSSTCSERCCWVSFVLNCAKVRVPGWFRVLLHSTEVN